MVPTRVDPGIAQAAVAAMEMDTFESHGAEGGATTARALYVAGPFGGSRHVLPDGLVSLGRGAEATITIDDPRVSRTHAALHIGAEIMLSDLGSANGTFVGAERLTRSEARTIALGQAFFIGDTALVVRAAALPRAAATRLSTVADVRRWLAALPGAPGTGAAAPAAGSNVALVTLRSLQRVRPQVVEAILGPLLVPVGGWLLWAGVDRLLVGLEASAPADVPRFERDVRRLLLGWSIDADVNARMIAVDEALRAGDGLGPLLSADPPVRLARGAVVIRDPAMEEIRRTVARAAVASVNVLICGETGVGKDVFASMLHELSPRAAKPFVGLNCASFPEALMESELFGHERGAFTGAAAPKPGLLETADGGTVFLDEIGDLALPLQAKLLRVIESREVTRVGGTRPRRIDVRFVAATNRDLAGEIAAGRFRRDLFYRLDCVSVTVPPLRDRTSEIEPLARHFLDEASDRFGVGDPRLELSPAAIAALLAHSWPGNVRELRNVIERAVLSAPSSTVEPGHLGLPRATSRGGAAVAPAPGPHAGPNAGPHDRPRDPLGTTATAGSESGAPGAGDAATSERDRIERVLQACGGNQSRAAALLGIPRRTLVRRIANLRLPRPRSNQS